MPTAFASDPSFHALHVVRIRGRAPIETVRAAVRRPDAIELLRPLAEQGHVEYKTGRAPGWAVTPQGRDVHAQLLAAEREAAGAAADLLRSYEAFVAANQELIEVCSAHQQRPDGTTNDHGDSAYDAANAARLAAVHDGIEPICRDLASAMQRFGAYEHRLGDALSRVRDGHHEWFTSPVLDSYHTVWFELHEDLLQTLGRARSAEGAG